MAASKLYTKIKVAEALKELGDKVKGVTVQTAREATKTVNGKAVKVLVAEDKPLAAAHVISAKRWKNGEVTITTIDGRRHPAKANTRVSEEDEEEVAA